MTTSPPRWDDVQLMAWADGVLPPEVSAELEAAFLQDADLADRAARMQQTREFVREAFATRLAPVPPALRASVEQMASRHQQATPSPVSSPALAPAPSPIHAAPRAKQPWWQRWGISWPALALPGAVVASVVAGIVGVLFGQLSVAPADSRSGSPMAAVGNPAPADLAQLLSRMPSGQGARVGAQGPQLAMVASFTDRRGRLCRDFSLQSAEATVESVACRMKGDDWQIVFSALQPEQQGGFSLAGPKLAIDSYLAGMGATEPLSESAEREALGLR